MTTGTLRVGSKQCWTSLPLSATPRAWRFGCNSRVKSNDVMLESVFSLCREYVQ